LKANIKERKTTIFDLLIARRGIGVTNPSDILFANLGIGSDSARIPADYS